MPDREREPRGRGRRVLFVLTCGASLVIIALLIGSYFGMPGVNWGDEGVTLIDPGQGMEWVSCHTWGLPNLYDIVDYGFDEEERTHGLFANDDWPPGNTLRLRASMGRLTVELVTREPWKPPPEQDVYGANEVVDSTCVWVRYARYDLHDADWAKCHHCSIPLILLLPVAVAYPLLLIMLGAARRARVRRRFRAGRCLQCGYDLHGNMSGVCPECGMPTSHDNAVLKRSVIGTVAMLVVRRPVFSLLCLPCAAALLAWGATSIHRPDNDWITELPFGTRVLGRWSCNWHVTYRSWVRISDGGLRVDWDVPLPGETWRKARRGLSIEGISVHIGHVKNRPIGVPQPSFAEYAVAAPLWLVALILGICPLFASYRLYRNRPPPPGHCLRCRYDLTGNVSGVCPECGTPTTTTTATATNKRRLITPTAMLIVGVVLILILAAAWWLDCQIREEAARRETQRMLAVAEIDSGLNGTLDLYRVHIGAYPTTEEGLMMLIHEPPDQKTHDRWWGPYLSDADSLIDPWGNSYQYACPAERGDRGFDLWSMGPDGVDNTDDDIGNWMIRQSN